MSGLFSSRPDPVAAAAATPAPKAPALMPDANSAAVMEARRKAQADIMGRAGRTSTILTPPKERGDYTSTTLGASS